MATSAAASTSTTTTTRSMFSNVSVWLSIWLSYMAKTLTLDIRSFLFTSAMLVGTIDLCHFIPS